VSTGFRFSTRLRVRWAEIDAQGVVFNGNYLTYFDVGVTEYWRAIGLTYPDRFLAAGVDTFTVKTTIEYANPARYDDELDVCVRTAKLGRTSLTLAFEIRRGAERLVTGDIVYVCVDPATRKPTPVPDVFRRTITEYEPTPPDA
jgi:acyl-CoA thioester hydrolase